MHYIESGKLRFYCDASNYPTFNEAALPLYLSSSYKVKDKLASDTVNHWHYMCIPYIC
jgi:hypothetical protein